MCVCVYGHRPVMPTAARRGFYIPWMELQMVVSLMQIQEVDQIPLEEHQVLFAAEPCLLLIFYYSII